MNSKHNLYYKNITDNLTPEGKIILIYNKLILLIERSKNCIINGKSETRFNNISLAQDIIDNMLSILDHKQEKELIDSLKSFYTELYFDIVELNFTKKIELYNKLIIKLKDIISFYL